MLIAFKSAADYKKHDHRNVAFQTPVLTNFMQHVVETNPPLNSQSLALLMGFFLVILAMFGFCFFCALLLASNSKKQQQENPDIELDSYQPTQGTLTEASSKGENPEGTPDDLPDDLPPNPLSLTETEGESPEGIPNDKIIFPIVDNMGHTVGEGFLEQAPVGENFIWAWISYFFSWLVPNTI
jgi:ABC-type transport system involved in multi-copper enzyme maturation permease subunit